MNFYVPNPVVYVVEDTQDMDTEAQPEVLSEVGWGSALGTGSKAREYRKSASLVVAAARGVMHGRCLPSELGSTVHVSEVG